jgi:hypothetical protein
MSAADRSAGIGTVVRPGPGPYIDAAKVHGDMPEVLAMDLLAVGEWIEQGHRRSEGLTQRAIAHSRAARFTRHQVAGWWDLFQTIIGDAPCLWLYASAMGYKEGQLARALTDFHAGHLLDSETYGTANTVPRPPRLTPIHGHVHRLAARDGWWCAYCGVEMVCACDTDLDMPMAVSDHVIPRSRGGIDAEDNRVLACVPCNSSKGDRTPSEWGRPLWGWCS